MLLNLPTDRTKPNKWLAKSKTRPNPKNWNHKPYLRGLVKMKYEDVMSALSQYDINIGLRTLQRHAAENLISKPKTISAGRNYGRITDFAEDTPAQELAFQYTKGIWGKLTIKDIAKIRKIALLNYKFHKEEFGNTGPEDYAILLKNELSVFEDIPSSANLIIFFLCMSWLLAYGIIEGFNDINDFNKYQDQIEFMMDTFTTEQINDAIETLRNIDF